MACQKVCKQGRDDIIVKVNLQSPIHTSQARRQGGFEGVRSNPPFHLQKILYTPLNCTFKVSYRLKVVH